MISQRDLIIYLAIKYNGDYDSLLYAIDRKECPDAEIVKNTVSQIKCKTLTMIDDDYPQYLKQFPRSPIVLFYYGDISLIDEKHYRYNLGVVGTRHPSEYGVMYTRKIVKEVAKDCNIVSGLAIGIDGEAHRMAIEAGTKTIAVLGSGIDNPWPDSNINLYHDILNSGGLIISEYPGTLDPTQLTFPVRNRIVAMLSNTLLVTEANGYKTGTRITVGFMLSYNKEVLAIPYSLEVKDSYCNRLLTLGAHAVMNGEDVLINMNLRKINLI